MKDRQKLLCKYLDFLYLSAKEYFPMIIEEIDIKKIKEEIINCNLKTKKQIEKIFMDKAAEYFNLKLNIMMNNKIFLSVNYDLYNYEYILADYLLKQTDFQAKIINTKLPKLKEDLTIDDCKKIVFDFYSELYKDDKPLLHDIKNIIYKQIEISFYEMRSYADLETNKIYISYSNNLKFLISMVHEVAHLIDNINNHSKNSYDERLIEVDSSFSEKIFLKYLIDTKLKIISGKNKSRSLNTGDLDKYNSILYLNIIERAFRIYEEYNMIYSLKNGSFDKNSLLEYRNKSANKDNLIITFYEIDDILNKYLDQEHHYLGIKELKTKKEKIEPYLTTELDAFFSEIRYFCSYILSSFFSEIINNKEIINNFIDYLKRGNIYDYLDFLNTLCLNDGDLKSLTVGLTNKYKKILSKNGYEFKYGKKINKEEINEELKKYKELKKYIKNNAWYGDFINQVVRMVDITKNNNFNLDIYPFDIEYQMDDNEVEEFKKIKMKILNIYNKL